MNSVSNIVDGIINKDSLLTISKFIELCGQIDDLEKLQEHSFNEDRFKLLKEKVKQFEQTLPHARSINGYFYHQVDKLQ